ncbi:hypothetical protein J3R83DRAFT_900 [Lanmaoa asiatica]|nr:hypothetical protein J3R83DRAFT_900 [Lanmaoa asiatica]
MESLQAQIDMSMSFAHNLVTSWIKPTHLAQLRSSGMNATQVLEEELRRPPRYSTVLLGVGASIPTGQPLAHEASKLKHRLGKNGAKNEGAVKSQPQDSSRSDDEEHKGRPAKRKPKVDPFGHEGSKKKIKFDSEATRYPSVENVSKYLVPPLKDSTLGEHQKHSQGFHLTIHSLIERKTTDWAGRSVVPVSDVGPLTACKIARPDYVFPESNYTYCPLTFGTVPRNVWCA